MLLLAGSVQALPKCSEAAADCRAWEASSNEFQALLWRTQSPEPAPCRMPQAAAAGESGCFREGADCSCRRVLEVRLGTLDGFALEVQTLGRAMRMALATGRMMVLNPSWCSNYASQSMHGERATSKPWGCLWEHSNACPYLGPGGHRRNQSRCAKEWHGTHPFAGVVAKSSLLFNTRFYGPALVQRLVLGDFDQGQKRLFFNSYDHALAKQMGGGGDGAPEDPIPNHDPVPDWERRYGAFWVRAQIQHFLWRPYPALAHALGVHPAMQQVQKLRAAGQPYIGFHIRYTDNIGDLRRDFGRDASVTRSFDHYMRKAGEIRSKLELAVRTIYLATDSELMLNRSLEPRWASDGWRFIHNPLARRSSGTGWMWFREAGREGQAANVAADVEALRQADYLVGSFQSNVYRLAAELNSAFHGGRTYSPHTQRIFPVESVEWYADP